VRYSLAVFVIGTSLALAAGHGVLRAQVSARQATAADLTNMPHSTEIASPMLIEVSVPGWLAVTKQDSKWTSTDSDRFICRNIHVPRIEVRKERGHDRVRLLVIAGLLSTDEPKDIDISIALVSDTKEIRKQSWEEFTADPRTRHPRSPEAKFEFTSDEFAALFAANRSPVVRVILNVKE
jgi:hypothetical protein